MDDQLPHRDPSLSRMAAENRRLRILLVVAHAKPWATFMLGFFLAWTVAMMSVSMTLVPASLALSARVTALETEHATREEIFAPVYAPGRFDELRLITLFDPPWELEKWSGPVLKISTDELTQSCVRTPHTYTVFER